MKTKITFILLLLTFSTSAFPQNNLANRASLAKASSVKTSSSSVLDTYYYESFEGEAYPPEGWQIVTTKGSAKDASFYNGHRGELSFSFGYVPYYETETEKWLISPQFEAASGDSVEFYVYPSISSSSYTENLTVLVTAEEDFGLNKESLESVFTDVALTAEFDYSDDSEWHRLSFDISSYAGQKIYVSFKRTAPGDGDVFLLDDFSIGQQPAADVSPDQIPGNKFVTVGDSYKPEAVVINYGKGTKSFDVTATISGTSYTSVKHVDNLAAFETAEVEFDEWTGSVVGKYTVQVQTSLAGDENSGNDILTAEAEVAAVFPGEWLSETDLPGVRAYAGGAFYNKKSSSPGAIDTGYVFSVGGVDETDNCVNSILKYNTVTKKWSSAKTALPITLFNPRVEQLGRKLYIFAGLDGSTYNDVPKLYIYDIEADAIGEGADMPLAERSAASGVYGDSLIYVFGGYSTQISAYTRTVQIYNINTGTWKNGTPFPGERRYELGGAICGNTIVIAGGHDSSGTLSTVDIGTIDPADPYNITWTDGGEYPQGVNESFSASAWSDDVKSYIVFCGGYNVIDHDVNSSVWIYDVKNSKWMRGPDMDYNSDYHQVTTAVRNDSVYIAVIGGEDLNPRNYLAINKWFFIGMDESALPVELNGFDVKADGNIVTLSWATATEVNNYGFEIARKSSENEYKIIASVEGYGNSSSPNSYSYVDKEAKSAGEYTYKLTQIDFDGKKKVEGEKTVTVSAPEVNELSQNYPNPCNPSTVIKYAIAKSGNVELKVYNTLGEEVATLANEYKEAGSYTATFNAAGLNLPSGIYIYRIKAANFTETKKLMFIK